MELTTGPPFPYKTRGNKPHPVQTMSMLVFIFTTSTR